MEDNDDAKRGTSRPIVTRRQLIAAAGVSALGGLAGCSGSNDGDDGTTTAGTETATTVESTTEAGTTTATEPSEPVGSPPDADAAHYSPEDGFADPAPWLETEEVTVRKVTEPTRRALNLATIYDEPTVVVFETSGTIDLENRDLSLTKDKTWIAGQTAPSPGITLTRGTLRVEANDCVIQHIRSKPGDGADYQPSSMDAIATQDGTENNVVDHCTASWSTDEALSVGFDTGATTVSNCLVSEALHDSIHPKGPHGYGTIGSPPGSERTCHLGNVWARNYARNPRTESDVVVANCTTYHFERGAEVHPPRDDSGYEGAFVGNVYLDPLSGPCIEIQDSGGGISLYTEDNVTDSDTYAVGPEQTNGYESLDEPPIWPDGLDPMPSGDVEAHNLQYAGARPADRTDHDERMVAHVRDRTGDFIDSQSEVGGYPELAENTRELTVPTDLRNWLEWHALAVENPDVDAPTV